MSSSSSNKNTDDIVAKPLTQRDSYSSPDALDDPIIPKKRTV